MKSMFQRFGTQPMKFTFTLQVRDINLPLIRGLNEGDLLHFSLERGSKSIEGEEVKAGSISSIGDMKTTFNQTLTIGVTLYKDSKGKFQEKLGTLSLKQRKKGILGKRNDKEAFKIIGVVPLELHMLTERSDEEFEAPLMMGGRDGATVNYKLIVLSGGLGRDDDDASSVNSSSRNSISASSAAPKGSLLKGSAAGGKGKKGNSNDDEEEDDDWKADFSNNKNKNNNNNDDDDFDPFDVPNPFDTKKSTTTTITSAGSGSQYKAMTTSKPSSSTTTPNKTTANPFDMSDSDHNNKSATKSKSTPTTANKKDTAKFNAEKEKLEPELEEELMIASLSPDAQDWKHELEELKIENQALKDREENLVVVTQKAEFFSKEAQRLEEVLRQIIVEQDRLNQQKQEVEAELKGRLAENEILVQEVIMTKLALVEVSTELDVMKKNCAQLKNKLGLTSSRMAALEVNGVKNGSGGVQQQQYQQQQNRQPQQQQQQYNDNNNNNNRQQQQQQSRNSDDNYKMQQQQQQQQVKRQPNRNNNY